MSTKNKVAEKTITGRIIASDWDDDDNIIGVVVEGENDDYIIIPEGKGKQLLDYVNDYISVTGTIRKQDGEYHILVKSFKVLEDEEIEDDEGYDDDEAYDDEDLDGYPDEADDDDWREEVNSQNKRR